MYPGVKKVLIIEKFITSKTGNNEDCEDGLFINEHFVAVVDGATSKHNIRYHNKTGGQIARDTILDVLDNVAADIRLSKLIEILTLRIKKFYIDNNILHEVSLNPSQRISASMIIYSKHYHYLWVIGDCQALVSTKLIQNRKKIDQIISHARSIHLHEELKTKSLDSLLKYDTSREYIKPLLISQSGFQNSSEKNEYNYAVLDGFKVSLRHIKKHRLLETDTEIILASDGYPMLFNTLSKTEERLKEIISEDPLCYKIYKSTKGIVKNNISFDDRTYIRFQTNI